MGMIYKELGIAGTIPNPGTLAMTLFNQRNIANY